MKNKIIFILLMCFIVGVISSCGSETNQANITTITQVPTNNKVDDK